MATTTTAAEPATALALPLPNIGDLIVATPGTVGGKPRIAGSRISVQHIYICVERIGMTPAQVLEELPHLTMAEIHAALAYYWSHRDEVHRSIEEGDRKVEALKAAAPPSILAERLAEIRRKHAEDDSLPHG